MNSPQSSDSHLVSQLQTVAKAASITTIFVACLVLVGWSFDITVFKSIIPGLPSMKANTAICFLLSGLSLRLQQQAGIPRRYVSKLSKLCAVVVIAIALLTLAQYLFDWNFGIDQWLFSDPANLPSNYPGRMAPNTALNFNLTGWALLFLTTKIRRRYQIVQLLTLMVAMVAGLALIGYAYNVKSFYQVISYTSLALHTAITFIVLCLGILLTPPEQGLSKMMISKNLGGFLARRLLIAVIAIPFILGWLINFGQQAALYNATFGLALLVIANISIFVILIWQAAKILDLIDQRRQQVEEELKETVATLQALFKASPLAIIKLDFDTNTKLWSPGAETIFGWTKQEVLGRPVPFIPNHELAEFQRLHQLTLTGSTVTGVEVQRQKKDGTVIDVAIWGAPLTDDQGNINSSMAVIADITERKCIQEALKESEERFRQLAENIQDVFWMVEIKQQKLLYVSPAYAQIWGRSCESLLENCTRWLETIHPDDRQSLSDSFCANINNQNFENLALQEFGRTYRIVRPDGTVRWIRDRGFPIKNELGEIHRIAGISEDITERKHTEEELRQTSQTLRALIQACPLGITVFSLDDGTVKLWNPAATTIFGWSEQEALGNFLPTVPEDKQVEFLANLEAVRQGQALTGIEVQRQKKGGLPIDLNVWAAPLIDDQGNVSCMSIVADISDRKRLEAEKNAYLLVSKRRVALLKRQTALRMNFWLYFPMSYALQ